MYWACREGHVEIVKMLIEAGVEVNYDVTYENEECNFYLYWACRMGHTEIVKMLIEAGVDIHPNNEYDFNDPLGIKSREKKKKEKEQVVIEIKQDPDDILIADIYHKKCCIS
jgi:ankyrin repeat protein